MSGTKQSIMKMVLRCNDLPFYTSFLDVSSAVVEFKWLLLNDNRLSKMLIHFENNPTSLNFLHSRSFQLLIRDTGAVITSTQLTVGPQFVYLLLFLSQRKWLLCEYGPLYFIVLCFYEFRRLGSLPCKPITCIKTECLV